MFDFVSCLVLGRLGGIACFSIKTVIYYMLCPATVNLFPQWDVTVHRESIAQLIQTYWDATTQQKPQKDQWYLCEYHCLFEYDEGVMNDDF